MIQELIDKHLKEKQEKPRESSGKWRPSSFGKCYRSQFWSRKGETPSNPPDDRALRLFAVGNLFHEFIEPLVGGETEVLIEWDDIKGFADIVLADRVLDIKTVHSQKFWYLEKENEIPITERERHNFLQVGFYALALKKDLAGIVMVSKDDFCVAEYVVPTEKLKDGVNAEILTLRKIWKEDKLPKAEPRCFPSYSKGKIKGYKECEWCPYLNKCKGVESGNNPSSK